MSAELDLEAIERRFDRVLARKEGRQEGTVGVVAMISAMDIPDLLAEVRRLKAVETAAKVWRISRHEEISGDLFHRACVALSEAVAALNGDLDRAPVAPPSDEDLERGRELVRRAKAYSASCGGGRAVDQLPGDAPVESAPAAELMQLQVDGTYEPVPAPIGYTRCPACQALPIGHEGDCEPC